MFDHLNDDEQPGEHQGDGGEQLHQHVQRRSGGVLERVTDGVSDDRGGVSGALLPTVCPDSTYFLALSQAPPPLFRTGP